jgi:hypothetical protein
MVPDGGRVRILLRFGTLVGKNRLGERPVGPSHRFGEPDAPEIECRVSGLRRESFAPLCRGLQRPVTVPCPLPMVGEL